MMFICSCILLPVQSRCLFANIRKLIPVCVALQAVLLQSGPVHILPLPSVASLCIAVRRISRIPVDADASIEIPRLVRSKYRRWKTWNPISGELKYASIGLSQFQT